ncbi:hypothetical protein GCM10010339_50530 [Streptomyces alanosinicus]|uniref:Uncharacterized protein n=1 Tax=Streptomyces alanosinicus TaxID=68171 RepID=A0A919D5R0_9ACTN|nr:hypothetical protein GCM10010339_50530 [Streptomyces alanosinicus]
MAVEAEASVALLAVAAWAGAAMAARAATQTAVADIRRAQGPLVIGGGSSHVRTHDVNVRGMNVRGMI